LTESAAAPPSSAARPLWRRNLLVLSSSQLVTVAAMSIVIPFIPFFVRELGVTDRAAVERWSGLIFSGPFLAAGLMSPVWGALGDRYGHKPMVVRAIIGLAVVNFLCYFVRTPLEFWILRLIQGAVTGFIPAALAITSATTPPDKLPDAMGKLNAAAAAGRFMGPAAGGILAGLLGYRDIFLLTGSMIAIGAVTVVLFLENPPPRRSARGSPFGNLTLAWQDRRLRLALVGLLFSMVAASMVMPIFPLFVEDLLARASGRGLDAATWTGIGFAVVAGFAMLGSAALGPVAQHVGLKVVLIASLCVTSIALALHPLVDGLVGLLAVRALLGIGVAGVQPVLISMISREAPEGRGGGFAGLASAATIFGFFLGPGSGGWLANHVGVDGVFRIAAGLAALCGIGAAIVARRTGRNRQIRPLPIGLPR
jgi:DHA1 family multidrug resistance protein-like MFS transporter